MLVLKIIGGLIALAIGIWLGMPGRYSQSAADIDQLMERPGRRARRAQRYFTPLDWMRRAKRSPDRLSRHRFRLAAPDEEREQGGALKQLNEGSSRSRPARRR